MCKVLKISRSFFYYKPKTKQDETDLINDICEIFRRSRNNYGTRKIKRELYKAGHKVSRRRIGRIMQENNLLSNYTIAQFRATKAASNEDKVKNIVNRKFDNQPPMNVIVSDLTYIRVGNRWNYICTLIDLFNREIIGFSAGPNKDAALVAKAFSSVQIDLSEINIFHTDRGSEFKNQLIEEVLIAFNIERSLSMKGCPYDNAVAEATYKIIKTEFVNKHHFESLDELQYHLADYVNWFNKHRIHSSLGYLTPVQYRDNHSKNTLKKVV